MTESRENVPVGGMVLVVLVILNAVVLRAGLTGTAQWYWALCLTVPLLLTVIRNTFKKQPDHIKTDLPGRLRWLLRVW